MARDVPVGFRAVRIRFDLDTGAQEDEIGTLIRLTERCCVVLQTLMTSPTLTLTSTRRLG